MVTVGEKQLVRVYCFRTFGMICFDGFNCNSDTKSLFLAIHEEHSDVGPVHPFNKC